MGLPIDGQPEQSLVSWYENRAFIDVVSHGCGNGCKYCYIDDPSAEQVRASQDEVIASVGHLLTSSQFKQGRHGTLISLSPSSEPFKSPETIRSIEFLLDHFLPLGNPVQIPTKETVPESIGQTIQSKMIYESQITLFVSLATLTRSKDLEPHATPPEERMKNFEIARQLGIKSCMYVKPFLHIATKERDLFEQYIQAWRPDALCVGVQYTANSSHTYEHPIKQGWTSNGLPQEGRLFLEGLRSACSIPAFYNSTCVSAYFLDTEPPTQVWAETPQFCVGCRPCGTNAQRGSKQVAL